jgi:hypothetical protein
MRFWDASRRMLVHCSELRAGLRKVGTKLCPQRRYGAPLNACFALTLFAPPIACNLRPP